MSNTVPDGWNEISLGEFLSFQRGHDLPSQRRLVGDVPVIGSGGVAGWHNTAIVKAPGITIGRAANLGVPTLVEQDFWPLNTTLFVTDFHNNDVRFCYFLLKTLDFTGFDSGSVQPMLNRNYIKHIKVAVPQPPEQATIGAILGALDDKIAANERLVQSSLSLADAHFARGVRGEGSELTLGDLRSLGAISFGDGYRTKKSEHGQPGLPILRVAEVGDFDIFPAYEDFVSAEYRNAMSLKISRPGDVVLTTKGTVGRATIMPADLPKFVYSPQVCYFRTGTGSSSISAEYLYLWFRSRTFSDQASSRKSQTDMADYLSLAELRTLRIHVLGERGAGELQRIVGPLLQKAAACRGENRALANLRDTLLPKLISGKLRLKGAARLVSDAV